MGTGAKSLRHYIVAARYSVEHVQPPRWSLTPNLEVLFRLRLELSHVGRWCSLWETRGEKKVWEAVNIFRFHCSTFFFYFPLHSSDLFNTPWNRIWTLCFLVTTGKVFGKGKWYPTQTWTHLNNSAPFIVDSICGGLHICSFFSGSHEKSNRRA